MAKKFHPDLNPNKDARDKFDKVSKYLTSFISFIELMRYYPMRVRKRLMILRWDLENLIFRIIISVGNREVLIVDKNNLQCILMMNMRILIRIREQDHFQKRNSKIQVGNLIQRQVKSFGKMLNRLKGQKMKLQKKILLRIFGMNLMNSFNLIMMEVHQLVMILKVPITKQM